MLQPGVTPTRACTFLLASSAVLFLPSNLLAGVSISFSNNPPGPWSPAAGQVKAQGTYSYADEPGNPNVLYTPLIDNHVTATLELTGQTGPRINQLSARVIVDKTAKTWTIDVNQIPPGTYKLRVTFPYKKATIYGDRRDRYEDLEISCTGTVTVN